MGRAWCTRAAGDRPSRSRQRAGRACTSDRRKSSRSIPKRSGGGHGRTRRDPSRAVRCGARAAREELDPRCHESAVPRVHEGQRRIRLRRVLRRPSLRGGDQAADERHDSGPPRSRVPQQGGAEDVHVVRGAQHRGGRVGTGVLGFDPGLLQAIADRIGTPAYVYSANLIRAQYNALDDALHGIRHRICYSVKANGNLGVLRVLKQLGAGADIVSVGELRRARLAGFEADGIVFSGVGKTTAEIEEAIRAGVGFINIESTSELATLTTVANDVKMPVRAGIRVNPDVAIDSHPYTKTGEKTAKFGIPFDEVVTVAKRIAAEPRLVLRGLAMHIGSQITDVAPYHRGAIKLIELVSAIRASGINTLEALDVGGGLGVRYHNEKAPTPKAFAEAVVPAVGAAGLGLLCEPGRYLVANAGVLLTRVLYRKHAGGKEYVIVDAGMSDFVRPSHYNAHHEILPLRDGKRPEEIVNVVGPICETGDFLALDRKLVAVGPGEVLAVLGTGAYGFVMSSTYNQRPRAPEVMVDGDRYYVARQRETLDDLVRGETAEPTTWYRA